MALYGIKFFTDITKIKYSIKIGLFQSMCVFFKQKSEQNRIHRRPCCFLERFGAMECQRPEKLEKATELTL